jgi:hypothetical protein
MVIWKLKKKPAVISNMRGKLKLKGEINLG